MYSHLCSVTSGSVGVYGGHPDGVPEADAVGGAEGRAPVSAPLSHRRHADAVVVDVCGDGRHESEVQFRGLRHQ